MFLTFWMTLRLSAKIRVGAEPFVGNWYNIVMIASFVPVQRAINLAEYVQVEISYWPREIQRTGILQTHPIIQIVERCINLS